MKKHFGTIFIILFMVFMVFMNGCSGGATGGNTDTAHAPATTDTMPVIHPQNMDSNSTITIPPVPDSNVVKPDTTVKNK